MTLRAATPADVPSIAKLWHQGWRDAHLGHVPAALARDRTVARFAARLAEMLPGVVVACDGDGVAGMCAIKDGALDQLFVAVRARGAGVARRLIVDGEARLLAAGWNSAFLYVIPQNRRARAFYERQGWTNAGPEEARLLIAGAEVFLPCLRYEKRLGGE